jgi:hypothetical protein
MSLFGRLGVSTLEAMRGWAGEARSRTSRAVQGSAPTSDHAANQVRRGPARADSSQRERLAEPGWSEPCVVYVEHNRRLERVRLRRHGERRWTRRSGLRRFRDHGPHPRHPGNRRRVTGLTNGERAQRPTRTVSIGDRGVCSRPRDHSKEGDGTRDSLELDRAHLLERRFNVTNSLDGLLAR